MVALKETLNVAGEVKWASSLKTTSLRHMMGSARKLAEDVKQRVLAVESVAGLPKRGVRELVQEISRLTNWSLHAEEGTAPFSVSPQNQNDAMGALESLVKLVVSSKEKLDSAPAKLPQITGPAVPQGSSGASKNRGWVLEGFLPRGSDDRKKVKFISARIEALKAVLKDSDESRWATILQTKSLQDMMCCVRKLAEEVRERAKIDTSISQTERNAIFGLARSIIVSTNWSCHAKEGNNPSVVTPENQNQAIFHLERCLVVYLNRSKSLPIAL
eukprot:Plantae.Rhodophyta-Palmaria_palmata.ctg17509.p1 GENE.Plantae.Rhodophyta-Palmaria_palmata.ctg17509~~Plantae.Rhodophyta-Palmaria_palmata.ctg17509.p1  ORF type:complete len:286 (+),score=57.50 Plantae.Rhodophyta-Palmaria_palmata.ctg17509:42-860(+)